MPSAPVPVADRHAADLARAQWRQARLDELAQIGMDQVRSLGAAQDKDDGALKAVVLRFARLSRALRLVLTLAGWVSDYILALTRGETIPQPWPWPPRSAAARADAPVHAGAETSAPSEAVEEAEPPEASERPETPRADAEPTEPREPADRFAYASWDEAMHAICKAFGIEDRSRFLESESLPLRPAEASGADVARPIARPIASPRPAPPPPRPSPWTPGGVLSRRAALCASTAIPDERMLQ